MSSKLLIDANLSWRLIAMLKDDYPEIEHLINTGLAEASTDNIIWEYARQNDYNIITNDEDFLIQTDQNFSLLYHLLA